MRLCILTQFYLPEMGAPQVRLSELAERLVDRGWSVEVLTALPNYPTGRVFPGYSPTRAVVELHGRIRTARVPLWPSNGGMAERLATYMSFVASASTWGARLMTKPDLLWVESPPLFLAYAAWALAAQWRCPYVFNVSDLWPESAVRMGLVAEDGLPTRLTRRLEAQAYRRSAGVTGQSDEILAGVRRVSPTTRTCLVTNGVDPSRFGASQADEAARALVGPEPGPVFVFAGLMGFAQGLDQVLDAAAQMPAHAPGRFVLVGDGPVRAALEARIAREGLGHRVRLVPAQPRERIPAILAVADAAIITLGMSIPGAVPSKIYEAMASALPIVLVADGEPARRVLDAGAGLVAAPGDARALLAAVERVATDPAGRAAFGAAGRRAAETLYHRDRIADGLDDFLRSAARA